MSSSDGWWLLGGEPVLQNNQAGGCAFGEAREPVHCFCSGWNAGINATVFPHLPAL